MGRMPNEPFVGAHFAPSRKELRPSRSIIGVPSMNTKTAISASTAREERAAMNSSFSMTNSRSLMSATPLPKGHILLLR
jgi:hypothetical protein